MQSQRLKLRRIDQSRVLPAPRFRHMPAIQAGPFVFISGLVGLDPMTEKLAHSGAAAETAQILNNLHALCDEQGWSIDHLMCARVFCAGDNVAAQVNAAWDAFFANTVPPTRTFVVVQALPLGAAVEIEFQLLV